MTNMTKDEIKALQIISKQINENDSIIYII